MTDDEIDALFRVPLDEFTSARNALAKARGAQGAAIKALEKPTLPAWAVNQLYWRERGAYDALVSTAMAMREAHARVISGRGSDVTAAEAAHATARRLAADHVRRLIAEAGEKATPATLDAVAETLQALPSDAHVPGRLTRPLKPPGFAALVALGIPVVQEVQGPGVQGPGFKDPQRAAARKAAQKALRTAEAAEVKAEAALAEAKRAADHAGRELARVRDKLVFLEKQRDDAEETVRRRTRTLQDAANARVQATQDLARLID